MYCKEGFGFLDTFFNGEVFWRYVQNKRVWTCKGRLPHPPDALAIEAVQLQQILWLDTEVQFPKGSENLHQTNKQFYNKKSKKSKSDFSWFPAKTLKKNTDLDWLSIVPPLWHQRRESNNCSHLPVPVAASQNRWTNSTVDWLLFSMEMLKAQQSHRFWIPPTAWIRQKPNKGRQGVKKCCVLNRQACCSSTSSHVRLASTQICSPQLQCSFHGMIPLERPLERKTVQSHLFRPKQMGN